jgi:hypothetical protein
MRRRIGPLVVLAATLALVAPALADPWDPPRTLGHDRPVGEGPFAWPSLIGLWAGDDGKFGLVGVRPEAVLDGRLGGPPHPRALPPALAGDVLLAYTAAPSGEGVLLSAPSNFSDYSAPAGVTHLTVIPAAGGAPSTVEVPVRPDIVGEIALAIAPSGAAAAAWSGTPPDGHAPTRVYLAARQPGQAFGAAEEVPDTADGLAGKVALAVDDRGAVTLAHAGIAKDDLVVFDRPASGGPLTRTTFPKAKVDSENVGVRLARGRDGRVAILWGSSHCDACGDPRVSARLVTRARDGRLGPVRTIASGGLRAAELAVLPDGSVLVVLGRATRKTSGAWFEREVIEAARVPPTGGAVRSWQRISPRTVATGPLRLERRRTHWTPTLAMNARGAAILAWRSTCTRCDDKLFAAYRPPGGRFRPASVVNELGTEVSSFGAALSPDGAGLMAWYEGAGPSRVALRASAATRLPGRADRSDARPPRVRVRVRKQGRRLRVRVSCSEACSAVLWPRGKGSKDTIRLTMGAHQARTGTLPLAESRAVVGVAVSDRAGNVRTLEARAA